MRRNRAQSSFELTTLIVIVIGALLAMQIYMKRGLQGRWKASTDELGEQYDFNAMNGAITYQLSGTTETRVSTVPDGGGGFWSIRTDQSNMVETKTGKMLVGTPP